MSFSHPVVLSIQRMFFLLAILGASQSLHAQIGRTLPPERTLESEYLSSVRQLTFEGRRAGEGYFNHDGTLLVFQSERKKNNPFFQIYLLDFETGDVEPISPGYGKTTCAWVHPDNNRILYASTQNDPEARAKQKRELELREKGEARRYSWDYDPTYDLIVFDRKQKTYTPLTNQRGYDAEGSYSPDGKLIAFASNRTGFDPDLDPQAAENFKRDPASMMEIYIMNADGSNVRQLTDVPGYDGGPFFSPDGKRICWRRFSENGATAEIMTMNIDGTDQRKLTRMGAMSWAPFYHPSGKYLIFTTNRHGFANFELYVVDVEGKVEPIRITDTDGFDGLASFSPDGKQLTWTSNRNGKKEAQIYLANWNHEAVLKKLAASASARPARSGPGKSNQVTGANPTSPSPASSPTVDEFEAAKTGEAAAKQGAAGFKAIDMMRHVNYLCRKDLSGRMTGSPGEKKATAYMAAYLDYLGFEPGGDNGTWFQTFEFPNGAELGPNNRMAYSLAHKDRNEEVALRVDQDFRPLIFSGNVEVEGGGVVWAGYGIVAPEREGQPAYDSYEGLDVKDKWVVVFRFVPEEVTPKRRQHLQFYAGLRKKAFYARERGAKGLIIVSGPNSQVRHQLVPLQNDFSPNGSSLPVISVTDAVAQDWLQPTGRNLKAVQDKLDTGESVPGFEIKGLTLRASTDVKKITGKGRNVIGWLRAGDHPTREFVLLGAHLDHLGLGKTGGSLARKDEKGLIHFGADDNASGVAATLEVAEYLVSLRRAGKLDLKRDVVIAGWSGEELGLHGSKHFADSISLKKKIVASKSFHDFVVTLDAQGNLGLNGEPIDLESLEQSLAFIGKNAPDFVVTLKVDGETKVGKVQQLKNIIKKHGVEHIALSVNGEDEPAQAPRLVAALNMDMVGRLEDKLILQGIGSSPDWASIIESKNAVVGLPLTLSEDTDLPTDASSFYQAGVPILSAFTGSHKDYHTPRDTPEKLNYQDAARIAKLMGLILRDVATSETTPRYVRRASKPKQIARGAGGGRAYLGTVPSYGDDVVGVKLSDVTAGAPAEQAGVRGGDIIVGLAGKKIENIYDYTAVIDSLKIGQETTLIVLRDGKELKLKITPGSRQ